MEVVKENISTRWRIWGERRTIGRLQQCGYNGIKRTAGLNWYQNAHNILWCAKIVERDIYPEDIEWLEESSLLQSKLFTVIFLLQCPSYHLNWKPKKIWSLLQLQYNSWYSHNMYKISNVWLSRKMLKEYKKNTFYDIKF